LCHDSPALSTASGQKFVARSRPGETNGRLPRTWQTELIDQVTWCSRATRTRPAQKNADHAPAQEPVTRPPISAGAARLTKAQTTKSLLVATRAPSLSRSGAYRSWLVLRRSNSQPRWAWYMPLSSDRRSVPYRHGECGSPARSEKAWWRRWSATHWMTGPWIAIDPAAASASRSGRFALNEPCVKCRW
jgi:hypothetical protein